MSAAGTPTKASYGSPTRSVRSTPGKSKSATPNSASRPASASASATKASNEGSWNLEDSNGKDINLETNVVHKAFQINKQLYSNDLDVEEEARESEKRTAERIESQIARVEAFQTKTTMRAEAASRAARKNRNNRKAGGAALLTTSITVTESGRSSSSSLAARPGSAPAALGSTRGAGGQEDISASALSRRDAIAAAKATALASFVKPVPKRRVKQLRATSTKAKAKADLAAAAAAATAAENEAKSAEARARAAVRARVAAEREEESRALKILNEVTSAQARTSRVRAPLDAPLARHVAPKTTAPARVRSDFNVDGTAVLQLSGVVGSDGTQYTKVDAGMAEAFAALCTLTPQDIREAASFVSPPPAFLAVCEAVCVLVGEEPGWVVAKTLLKRRDFVPALALANIDNIPFARIRKCRSRGYLRNPLLLNVGRVAAVSKVGAALLLWVQAIDAAAPPAASAANAASANAATVQRHAAATGAAEAPTATALSTDAFLKKLQAKKGLPSPSSAASSSSSSSSAAAASAAASSPLVIKSLLAKAILEGTRAAAPRSEGGEGEDEDEGEDVLLEEEPSQVEVVEIEGGDEWLPQEEEDDEEEDEEEEEEQIAAHSSDGRRSAAPPASVPMPIPYSTQDFYDDSRGVRHYEDEGAECGHCRD